MSDTREQLEDLHTSAIDARNGYREAFEDADKHGLVALFKDMASLHQSNADELAAELARRGTPVDADGSFMSAVHQTIMSIRGLFGALDQSVLPGLIDGEERNLAKYDAALEELASDGPASLLLKTQRERIASSVKIMKSMNPQ